MKAALILLPALLCAPAWAMDKRPMTESDAFRDMMSGVCGFDRQVGTGLVDGKGWLHQPISGSVEVCTAEDGGTIQVLGTKTATHCVLIDWLGGKPYYVVVRATEPTQLVWKIPGFERGAVPIGFQSAPKTGAQ